MNGTLRTANSEMHIDGALLDDAHGFAIGEICRAIGDDARAGGQRLLERGAIIGDERDRDVLLMRHVVAQGEDQRSEARRGGERWCGRCRAWLWPQTKKENKEKVQKQI